MHRPPSYCRASHAHARGWTLIEMLSVCAVIGAAAALSVPSFRETALNAQRTAQVNALVHALHAGRTAAIQRSTQVVLCKSRDGQHCDSKTTQWDQGWLMFANLDGDSPAAVDAGEPILLHQPAAGHISIRANRDTFTHWPVSTTNTAMTFVVCDTRGAKAARAIIVGPTGRPRVSTSDASNAPLACPST